MKWIGAVTLQPLVAYQTFIPHMKAWDFPFPLPYGRLICTNRLHSDRPKCGGMVVDPRALQNHAEMGLFVPGLKHTNLIENFKIFVS